MPVRDIIIQQIKDTGPISFRDFMEMALYYQDFGYYTSAQSKIGEDGDYYTSPYFSSLFGELLAQQLEEMWQLMDQPEFTIVEYGAGPGTLCHDILQQLKSYPAFYEKLKYCIIEKSATMRDKEQMLLKEKVEWIDDIAQIAGFTGCVISNEVLDNFAVHRVIMQHELMEVYVDYTNDFIEVLQPAPGELKEYFKEMNIVLPDEYCTEINLQARHWIEGVSKAIHRGYVITIDYGFPSAELYRPYRNLGSLACYYRHHISDQLYEHIGEQDITAHVNFSAVKKWGGQYGLECCGFTNQAHFLLSLGMVEHVRKMEQKGVQYSEKEKKTVMNTMLMDMGSKFHVLVQGKNIPDVKLKGLQLARQLV